MAVRHITVGNGGGDNPRINFKGPEGHPMIRKLREVEERIGPHSAARRDMALNILKNTLGPDKQAEFTRVQHLFSDYSADYQKDHMYDAQAAQQLIEDPKSRESLIASSKLLMAAATGAKDTLIAAHGLVERQQVNAVPKKDKKQRTQLIKVMEAERYFLSLEERLKKLVMRLEDKPIPELMPDLKKLKPRPFMDKQISAISAVLLGMLGNHFHEDLVHYCKAHAGTQEEAKAGAEQLTAGMAMLLAALEQYSVSAQDVMALTHLQKAVAAANDAQISPVFQKMTRVMNARSARADGAQERVEHARWGEMTFLRSNIDTLSRHLTNNLNMEKS